MRFCICNLNGTTIKKGTNINSEEIINICEGLNKSGHFCEVLNYSKVQEGFNNISIYDQRFNINNYDKVIIMGSMANFFGGVRNDDVINIYKALAKYTNGKVYYIFNDFRLPFRQLWKSISNRDWNDCNKDDVIIKAPMVILSQFRDLKDALKANLSDDSNIVDIKFFDLAKWILNVGNNYADNKGEYDLIYGGSFRAGNRLKKFNEFFVNRDSNIAIYGSMSARNFKEVNESNLPKFLGRVESSKCISENAKGFSTIIIGEKHYNNSTVTLRVYESMLANCAVFIDTDFDKYRYLGLPDFMYITTGSELDNKIKYLKDNADVYKRVIDAQHQFIEKASKYNVIDELLILVSED